jgi:hypothetical protein
MRVRNQPEFILVFTGWGLNKIAYQTTMIQSAQKYEQTSVKYHT